MKVFICVVFIVCVVVLCEPAAEAGYSGIESADSDDYDPSERGERDIVSARRMRLKRTLVYTQPSTLLLIFGLGTPLQLDRESVIVGAFTKMIYALPDNSSAFTEPGVLYSRDNANRENPATTRWSLYRALGRLAEVYGFGEGRACVLRAICEAAAAPFDERGSTGGILHRLLQTFLSPSSTGEEKYGEYRDREYRAAERLGEHVGENCHALYPECRRSFLDVFSSVMQQ